PAVLENAPAGTVVFDDDGGRAQVIPRQVVPKHEISFHGGPVLQGASIQALFLGSGWRTAEHRGKESGALAGLIGGSAERTGLVQEDLLDPLENRSVSDLEVQRRLDALV